jgi:hypothetical protein
VACPFFMPLERLQNGSWSHAHRLPLGCGWGGKCMAPGHEGETPTERELTEFCNLGYAVVCGRLPHDRAWDSVRFGARTFCAEDESAIARVEVRYVCERDHRPAGNGCMEFDAKLDRWATRHPDAKIQRMAECYLSAFLEKRKRAPDPVALGSDFVPKSS